ncbi:MAG TPA: hypothetical protein VE866_00750, partial [Candidatus Binatia bacterium]|nr:hypothetical protein [Candidatus Binatia bacterium]
MKYAVLALLLALVQAAPTMARKAPDKGSGRSNQQPTSSVPATQNAAEPQPQKGQAQSPHDSDKQIIVIVQQPTSGWEKAYVILTGLLAIIGVFGVAAAFRTLRAVESQAHIMQGQLTAMQGQLAQMDSAGKQTDQLIEQEKQQTKELRDATDIALAHAEAAVDSAKAAKASSDALINAERAWIIAELRCKPGTSVFFGTNSDGETTAIMDAELWCYNSGKSPAWITERLARLIVVAPEDIPTTPPELSLKDIVDNRVEPVGPKSESKFTWNPTGTGRQTIEKLAVIYGVVRYRDIFEQNRETWFAYRMDGFRNARSFTRLPHH